MAKVAVLTSGGVDSSLALALLAEQAEHSLTACYLKIWLSDELAFLGRCPWQDDLARVRSICDRLGVPLQVLSLQRQYFDTVVSYTLAELRAGRTPSPDVVCNRAIKFGAFLDQIDRSFELVASGHYARSELRSGTVHLLRGVDPVKDQTYFLCQLSQAQVARCLFPIGHLLKREVRLQAQQRGLPNWNLPDSQGICFLGRIPYQDFVEFQLGCRPGEIRELDSSRLLGSHRGHWFHTIGQRRGLGLGGGPWYVAAKDVEQNLVWVVHARDLGSRARRVLSVPEPNWIADPPRRERLLVRIRHGQQLLSCTARVEDGGAVSIRLDQADPGIAQGQFAVLYDGAECLGGGAIGPETDDAGLR